jgi:hypothetical protein
VPTCWSGSPGSAWGEEFIRCFENQAERKPASSAATAVASGMAGRVRANVPDQA